MTSKASGRDTALVEAFEEHDVAADQALGFWLYLMSDLVLFAAFFATYAVLGHNYAGGPTGRDLFHLPYTFGETMLLLLGSATFGMVVLSMHQEKRKGVLTWLLVTFLLGCGFIAMEMHEFRSMILEGNGPGRSAFLSSFFTLVGTHGLHVTSGLTWMAVMMGQVIIKGLTLPVRSRLMRLGMFWHFLDVVWVAVFTIVYLMGVV